jgi:hypothetical protein
MVRRARSWHALLSNQHVGAGGAVFKVSRESPAPVLRARAAIEAGRKKIPFGGIQKCRALICF